MMGKGRYPGGPGMGHPAGIPKTMGGHPAGIPKVGGMGHPFQAPKSKPKPLASKTEAISRVPFFAKFSESDIANIEPFFSEYKFEKNQYLFWEGDPANKMFVIKSGRVRLLKTAASGKEMVLEVMVPGQICGGHALFADTHRNSGQAVEPTIAYGLSHDSYDQLLSKYPEIARGIIKYLGAKLMDAHDVIISLVSSKVDSRIASVIVRLCENHGTPSKDGILINIRLTRRDIADIVGSTVETTIRTISKFQKKGLLSTVSGRLLIKNYDAFVEMMKTPR
jgi:CRP-like cAMP-binding protein